MGTIRNAADYPLFDRAGDVPDVSGTLEQYYQPIVFTRVVKQTIGFQVNEIPLSIHFRGVIQPFTDRQLNMKPEGQRAWSWFLLHSDPALKLDVDEIVFWKGGQTRVMALKDFSLYGYLEYHLVQDWTGAGPFYAPIQGGTP